MRTPKVVGRYWVGATIRPQDMNALATYDVVVFDMEAQHVSPAQMRELKVRNPGQLHLAYTIPTGQWKDNSAPPFKLRRALLEGVGERYRVMLANGKPYTHDKDTQYLMDLTDPDWRWRFCRWAQCDLLGSGLWDGLYLDTMGETVAWRSPLLDLDRDGKPDIPAQANAAWLAGCTAFAQELRAKVGPEIILVGNGYVTQVAHYNGRWWEQWPFDNGEDLAVALGRVNEWASAPGRRLNVINPVVPVPDTKAALFGLAVALYHDCYFLADDGYTRDVNELRGYPEYEAELGEPLRRLDVADYLVRLYERGAVVVEVASQTGRIGLWA
ncbi:MAG: putative glycoside hydrolase, partial [Dehalococcoidia bacterium]|nr:putative glycoside hydrolase [Dehalococcoidia bacterium]